MYNGTIVSLITIMTPLSHLSHPYDTFQFCSLLIIKHNPYDIIIRIITLIYYYTYYTYDIIIRIITLNLYYYTYYTYTYYYSYYFCM